MPRLAVYNKALDYSYAPGVFPSLALLDAQPRLARRLLVHSDTADSDGVRVLVARCQSLGVRTEVADQALSRISRKENCHAAIVFSKYQSDLRPDAPHIVLHHPADMGNLGTILRTCLGFGLTDLAIIQPAADVFDPRVVRASMGALFGLRVALYDSFEQYRQAYPAHALYPFMLQGATALQAATRGRPDRYALIFGNEGAGLPSHFAALGTPVRIVHSDHIDSLNLSVAVAIAAYAFTADAFATDAPGIQ